jgi:hypothetical protein
METQQRLEMHSESDWGVAVEKVQDATQTLEMAYALQVVARFAAKPREQRFAGAAAQAVAEVVDAANLAAARVADAAKQLAALDRAEWNAENP